MRKSLKEPQRGPHVNLKRRSFVKRARKKNPVFFSGLDYFFETLAEQWWFSKMICKCRFLVHPLFLTAPRQFCCFFLSLSAFTLALFTARPQPFLQLLQLVMLFPVLPSIWSSRPPRRLSFMACVFLFLVPLRRAALRP